jgi:hypothetical protein
MEDSPWRAANIAAMILSGGVKFDRGVEVGYGAGQILQEMATRFSTKDWAGYDVSPDVETFWEQ